MKFYLPGSLIIKISLLFILISGCASGFLKNADNKKIEINEFEEKVSIIEVTPASDNDKVNAINNELESNTLGESSPKNLEINQDKTKNKAKANPKEKSKSKWEAKQLATKSDPKIKNSSKNAVNKGSSDVPHELHQPDIEGSSGFIDRRPLVDPFKPSEKITYDLGYMGVNAGHMTLELKPFVMVNGRKHYHFMGRIWTNSFFSSIYTVEDSVSSMIDYETLLPSVFKLHVKESTQIREARLFIDWKNLLASYWEKRVTEKEGTTEKKQSWKVLPYSQDVFSSVFYFRVFDWKLNDKRSFRVADEEKNQIYVGEVLRQETVTVPAGRFDSFVIIPKVQLQGHFKPNGDILVWVSNDSRRIILKITAKVAFGSVTAEATHIE